LAGPEQASVGAAIIGAAAFTTQRPAACLITPLDAAWVQQRLMVAELTTRINTNRATLCVL
jgi:hypothetical protein